MSNLEQAIERLTDWISKYAKCSFSEFVTDLKTVLEASKKEIDKPPIGVAPEFIWIEQRFWDIADACNRRIARNMDVPDEWQDEMWRHFVRMTGNSSRYDIAKSWMVFFGRISK